MWQSHGDVASLSEMPFPEDEKSAFFFLPREIHWQTALDAS